MKRHLMALGISALALVAGGLAVAAPGASQAALVTPIRHVVVLDLENHTFDNVLGYWCNSHPGRCPGGGMPASVTLSNGSVVTPRITPDKVPNIGHSVRSQQLAINGGKMNGWQNVNGCQASTGYACISGYQPSQIPNEIALAQRFALSDRTFSMANSPSWGGHLYVAISSLDGFWGDNPKPATGPAPAPGPGWGCDSNLVTTWTDPQGKDHTGIPSCIPDPALGLRNGGAFKPTPVPYVPTIFNRLDAARLSWKIYGTTKPANWGGGWTDYNWSICPSLADCLYTSQDHNLVPSSRFVTDAQAGRLPAYSVVVPGNGTQPYSQHNGTSMAAGDNWIGQVASAVMNGPQWSSTALFITYDDCGCFYDHVRPGVNPDGTPQGPRMPLVVVSPYARAGYTDTTPTTFAGILAFTEHTFGLAPLNANDRGAYDFSHAFNYAQPPLRPVHMVTRPLPAWARHIHLTPAMRNDPT